MPTEYWTDIGVRYGGQVLPARMTKPGQGLTLVHLNMAGHDGVPQVGQALDLLGQDHGEPFEIVKVDERRRLASSPSGLDFYLYCRRVRLS